MITFLAGGTGTPKLLDGAMELLEPGTLTVVGNTGDDIELGGLLVCPDIDTVLFHGGDVLDRETWWGIADDTTETHTELHRLAEAADLETGPRYLPDELQTDGREIARWRRFSGVAEFMEIGDKDRAVHLTRTSLLDEGRRLTAVIRRLATAFGLDIDLIPMSDDPVASIVHTDEGELHFQEYWVGRRGEPPVEDVEFRGASNATPTQETRAALRKPVVIGPSNPVTSIGPILSLPGVRQALHATPVVVVSPFVGDTVFSGPAAELMNAVGYEASTTGVARAYPFADGFVLDDDDDTALERPVVRSDISIDDSADAERVTRAVLTLLERLD